MRTIIIIGILSLLVVYLVYYLKILYTSNERILKKYSDLQKEFFQEKIENSDNIRKYQKYISFFNIYYNEDWSRDTPFIEQIEALRIFIPLSKNDEVYPLETLVRDIPLNDAKLNRLKETFREDVDILFQMRLAEILLFSADLKSYREDCNNYNKKSAQEYYQDKLNFYKSKFLIKKSLTF